MSCQAVFIREPLILDLEAMGNDMLPLSINLFQDKLKTIPADLTGYTPRSALRDKADISIVINADSITLTNTPTVCNITAIYHKSTIEALTVNRPYLYDISVDNSGNGDSFTVWYGVIVFLQGASS